MNRKPQAKAQATILVREMTAAGIEIKHQQALEFVAKMNGFRDWNAMSSAPDEKVAPIPVAAPPAIAMEDIRILGWSIDDVQTVCPYLSDDEALMLLQRVEHKHDASMGISWDTFPITASYFFKDRILNGTFLYEDGEGKNWTVDVTINLSENGKLFTEGKFLDDFEVSNGVVVINELPVFNGFPVEHGYLFCEDAEERNEEMRGLIADLEKAGTLTSILSN